MTLRLVPPLCIAVLCVPLLMTRAEGPRQTIPNPESAPRGHACTDHHGLGLHDAGRLLRAPHRTLIDVEGRVRDERGVLHPDIHWAFRSGGTALLFRTGGISIIISRKMHDDEVAIPSSSNVPACAVLPRAPGRSAVRVDMALPPSWAAAPPLRHGNDIAYVSSMTGAVVTVRFDADGVHLTTGAPGAGAAPVSPVRASDLSFTGAARDDSDHGTDAWTTPFGTLRVNDRDNAVSIRVPGLGHAANEGEDRSAFRFESVTGNVPRAAAVPFLGWSTYLGGGSEEFATGIAIGPDRSVYVTGWTTSLDFPSSPGAVQFTRSDTTDAFIACFGRDGSRRWTTYFGGSGVDIAMSIAVSQAGDLAICGHTSSPDLPAPRVGQSGLAGATDAFVALLTSTGALQWTMYFGGSLADEGHSVAFVRDGFAITGRTSSVDLPTDFNGFQFMKSGGIDAFIGMFDLSGTRRWSTYYGGGAEDWGHSIRGTVSDDLVIVGHTESTAFPVTPNAFETSFQGVRDGFLLIFSPTGTRRYATFIGGFDWDDAYDVHGDASGNIVVAGGAGSMNFPVTPEAFQRMRSGTFDAFVAKFNALGQRLWSTYIGGTREDLANGVAVFPSGNIMVTGLTRSADFPMPAGGYQPTHGGPILGDAFIVKFSRDGHPGWGSFHGGAREENGLDFRGLASVSTDRFGATAFSGWTSSTDFPTTPGAFQTSLSGPWDGFAAMLDCVVEPPLSISVSGPTEFCDGDSVTLDAGDGYAVYQWSTGETVSRITVRQSGVYSVFVIDTSDCGMVSTPVAVTAFPLPQPRITALGDTILCAGDSVTLDAGAGYAQVRWSTGDTSRTIRVGASTTVSVQVVDVNGCTGISPDLTVVVHPRPVVTIQANGPLEFCDGESVVLDAGAGHTSYEWSSGERTRTITVTRSGLYTVRVTNPEGCDAVSAPVPVTVHPLPAAVITPLGPVTVCDGDSVVLDAGPSAARYQWSTGDTTRRIVVRVSATVTVTVSDAFPCSATSAPLQVTVHPRPVATITPRGPVVFCEGDSVELDGGAGVARYLWSTGDTTRFITVRATGRIGLTVAFATGCDDAADPIDITVHPLPRPVIQPNGPLSFCDGDSVILTAPSGFVSTSWNTGQTSQSIVVRTSGVFTVTVRDANGCDGTSAPVTVTVFPNPAIPVITQSRDTLVTAPAYALQWSLDGAALPGETGPWLLIPRSGSYTVTVTSADGCSTTSAPFPVVIARTVVAIPDMEAEPGTHLRVPLILRSSEGLPASGAKSFRATVRILRSIFVPTSLPAQWSDVGFDRRVQLTGSWSDTVGTLAEFDGLATLGDQEQAPFLIEDFEWDAGAIRVVREDGRLRLRICREGGDRLFDDDVRLALHGNRPNPFNAVTRISYSLLEDGPIRLFITDMLGREVAVLAEGTARSGSYDAVFDAGALPSGVYHCTLITTSARRSIRLLLQK